jgi:hypothetical protein
MEEPGRRASSIVKNFLVRFCSASSMWMLEWTWTWTWMMRGETGHQPEENWNLARIHTRDFNLPPSRASILLWLGESEPLTDLPEVLCIQWRRTR